jgi:hypothetical protein
VIRAHSKQKIIATSMASTQNLSFQQKQVEEIVEEYKDIFVKNPIDLDQVKHPIDMNPVAPLPNRPVYRCSLMESDEIRC